MSARRLHRTAPASTPALLFAWTFPAVASTSGRVCRCWVRCPDLAGGAIASHRAHDRVNRGMKRTIAFSVVLVVLAAYVPTTTPESTGGAQPLAIPSDQPSTPLSAPASPAVRVPSGPSRLVWRFTETL